MTDKTFEELARPLIEYINTKHPHTMIIITHASAEVLEGVEAFTTGDYLRD